MSKQFEARVAQEYVAKAPSCGDCSNLKFDMITPAWMREHNEEVARSSVASYRTLYDLEASAERKNLRCGIGGFAVKSRGSCKLVQI